MVDAGDVVGHRRRLREKNYIYRSRHGRERLLSVMVLPPEEIRKRGCRNDITRVLIDIHDRAERLLHNKQRHYGEMMRKALVHMINGWDSLI